MNNKQKKELKHKHKKDKNNDPNFLFDPSQYTEINTEFYNNFLDGYFFLKVSQLYNLTNSPENKIMELFNFELEELKVSPDYKYSDTLVDRNVTTEIVMTTFHCLETYLRMYISHSALSECPNLILANLSIKDYHENINAILSGKLNYMNPDLSDDEILAETFYFGMENLEYYCANKNVGSVKEVLDVHKEYLKYAAGFVKNNSEYNTYKHGFYLQQSTEGFSISNSTGVLRSQGSAFTFITKEKNKNGKSEWAKTTKYFDREFHVKITIIFEYYLSILMDMWKFHYIGNDDGYHLERPIPFDEILRTQKSNTKFQDSNFELEELMDGMVSQEIRFHYRYFVDKNE